MFKFGVSWSQIKFLAMIKTLLNIKIQFKTFCVLKKGIFDDFFAFSTTENDHFSGCFWMNKTNTP